MKNSEINRKNYNRNRPDLGISNLRFIKTLSVKTSYEVPRILVTLII